MLALSHFNTAYFPKTLTGPSDLEFSTVVHTRSCCSLDLFNAEVSTERYWRGLDPRVCMCAFRWGGGGGLYLI